MDEDPALGYPPVNRPPIMTTTSESTSVSNLSPLPKPEPDPFSPLQTSSLHPSPSSTVLPSFHRPSNHRILQRKFNLNDLPLESRGHTRVPLSEKEYLPRTTIFGYLHVLLVWFSLNLAANNIALGMLGPEVFGLGFGDASVYGSIGAAVGSVPVAWIATFGPVSGCRTLIFARYTMGWWPSRLIVLLNIVLLLGYSMIDCVVAGQILSAVSGSGHLSIAAGVVISAAMAWVVSTFGIKMFHLYQRYAWIPMLIVLCILTAYVAPHINTTTPSVGSPRTVIGNRLTFFSICLSSSLTYIGISADYFVYFPTPPSTSLSYLSVSIFLGLALSFTFTLTLGSAVASGIPTTPAWLSASTTSPGAVLVAAFSPLGTFGKFLATLLVVGEISNLIPGTYSSGIDFQMLLPTFSRIPRVAWNLFGILVYMVCALAGRNSLAEIFTNFLALMGYWCAIFTAITIEEHFFFRVGRWKRGRGYDWENWDVRSLQPAGIAAMVAFLMGWAGAILCMAQVWYIGPVARLVGDKGADMGNYVGFAWAALVYPPFRYWELRKFGR